jgi:hypothetical protein
MKRISVVFAVALLLAGVAGAGEKELKSGLPEGEFIGAFDVVKCAGAEDDGVKIGSSLCYRCKYGGRPMVMVFARTADDENLAGLLKGLDKVVADNESKDVKAFVNILGEDREKAEEAATKLGKSSKTVPVVVPVEFEDGPKDYNVSPEADVTIIIAAGGKVVGNHAFAKGGLDEKAIEAIVADATKKLTQ